MKMCDNCNRKYDNETLTCKNCNCFLKNKTVNLSLSFPNALMEQILKVCKDIAEKDKTFIYHLSDTPEPLIIIENPDKDIAWKRGYWLKNKVSKSIHFEVEAD